MPSIEPVLPVPLITEPACSDEQHRVRQKVNLEPDEWIQDSGCSRHMTRNKDLFSSYKTFNGGNVLFGSNTKIKIIGKGTISHNSLSIHDVSHVENLSFNLLSVGQICDKKCKVLFSETDSEIIKDGITIGKGIRKHGLYIMKLGNSPKDALCLTSIDDSSTLWHRRLGHANMRLIQSLSSKELVRNLPKLKFEKLFCDACNVGKQVHESHKAKNMVSTSKCLELLHMDLFGPSAVQSYGGNFYTLVIVDDYSRYTWTRFLKHKNEAFDHFEFLSKKIQVQKGCLIISIRTDHGREFDNEVQFGAFCDANGITHNFSAPRTPQSNGVVERKNRTLQEMSRTMLNEQSIPQKFWCNAVDTSTYILNRILIRPFLGKTPYELFKGRKPNLEYFKVFGSKCFILNTKDYLTKFDPKATEGIFLGYSPNSKAYIVLNKETMKVEESLNIKFDESPPPKSPPLVDDDLLEINIMENQDKDLEVKENEPLNKEITNIKSSKDHPIETVIGSLNQRTLRSQVQNQHLVEDVHTSLDENLRVNIRKDSSPEYFQFSLKLLQVPFISSNVGPANHIQGVREKIVLLVLNPVRKMFKRSSSACSSWTPVSNSWSAVEDSSRNSLILQWTATSMLPAFYSLILLNGARNRGERFSILIGLPKFGEVGFPRAFSL
ncbi:retrovirus-related pol polyprotein from transposon TNT 1-94 [Tanacetum coccineum]